MDEEFESYKNQVSANVWCNGGDMELVNIADIEDYFDHGIPPEIAGEIEAKRQFKF